jgi:hypothetical protein
MGAHRARGTEWREKYDCASCLSDPGNELPGPPKITRRQNGRLFFTVKILLGPPLPKGSEAGEHFCAKPPRFLSAYRRIVFFRGEENDPETGAARVAE